MNSLQVQRVLHGTTDVSLAVNDFRAYEYAFSYTSGQYLYIGSNLPFNNAWIELGTTVNLINSVASVDIWWANDWHDAVEVFDGTSASGKSLAQSGRIQWTTDRLKSWDVEQTSSDVTGLSATNIYNMYWIRISWSATMTGSLSLKYIGQKFSQDSDLFGHYPDLDDDDLLGSYATGKTNWDEQHFMAAEQMVRYLIKNGTIKSSKQLFDPSVLVDASCHKVAETIYHGMGVQYIPQRDAAGAKYKEDIGLKNLVKDEDGDGKVEPQEQFKRQGKLYR